MISVKLRLPRVFGNYMRPLFLKHGKLTTHKYWEVQGLWTGWQDLFNFEVTWLRRCDHAGVYFELGVLGCELNVSVYDNRHWNRDEGKWANFENKA